MESSSGSSYTGNISTTSTTSQPISPYINLLTTQQDSKSTTSLSSSYIQTILRKAISDPKVYAGFSELSSLPGIQNILQESTTGQALARTLDLFSFGVYNDYHKAMNTYIKLTDVQETKLKMLTVVSIVQEAFANMGSKDSAKTTTTTTTRKNRRHHRSNNKHGKVKIIGNKNCAIVQYSKLCQALHINMNMTPEGTDDENTTTTTTTTTPNINSRALEDLLIQCIYANLLPTGTKLDQKNSCLIVQPQPPSSSSTQDSGVGGGAGSTVTTTEEEGTGFDYVLCRDINIQNTSNDIPNMIAKLQALYNRGENVKCYLQENLDALKNDMVENGEMWKNVDMRVQQTKEMINEKNRKNVGGSDGIDTMLVDTEGGGGGIWAEMGVAAKRQLKRSRGGRSGRS